MKLRLILVSCILLSPIVCLAQDTHSIELFGGYSREGRKTDSDNGWNASLAVNVYKNLDLVADFAGNYNSQEYSSTNYSSDYSHHRYAFLFGPRFAYRRYERLTPFVHLLIGVERNSSQGTDIFNSQRYTYSSSQNLTCVAVGAGLDVKVKHGIAVRAIQLDGLGLTDRSSWAAWDANYRISTGLVFRLGGEH